MSHLKIFNSKIEEISNETNKYFNEAINYVDSINIDNINNLTEIKPTLNRLNMFESRVKGVKVDFDINSIKMYIDKEYSSRLDDIESERNDVMISLRNKVENTMEKKKAEIREQNAEIRRKNDELRSEIESANSRYKQLEIKRQRLLEYSPEILQLCSDYGIKVSDININNDMFTIEELNLFYEQFYTFISNNSRRRTNPIRWIRDKLNDNIMYLSMLLIFVIVVSFSPVLDIFSIVLILYIIYSQSIQESLVKKYTIMAGLAFNINPMELGIIKEIPEDMIEEEISEDIDIDNEPEFKVLLDEVNLAMENISDYDVRTEMSKAIASYTKDYPSMRQELDETLKSIEGERSDIIQAIKDKREEILTKEKELKSRVKLLGQEFSHSGILNTKVKLGIDKDSLIYEEVDLGMQNLIFKQSGNNKDEIDKFIKVLLANYYCNVRPGYFDVTIYDPNGMGRSMAGFYSEDMDQVFNISSDNLDSIIKDLREHTDMVIRTTKGMNINEYNKEVSKDGRLCLNYKLLLILSQPKTVEENEALRSFIEYSADLGVFVWMVSDMEFPNTKIFNKPFEGVNQPIDINTFDFPIEVIDNLTEEFENLKSPALMWDEFKDRSIPNDEIWSYNADEFIEFNPGYEDGDPSKPRSYTLGNTGDVHGLIVGGTGAGKSVFINNIIANIVTKYHPNNVSLWLIDFKGSEFNFYLKRPDIGQPYILPHIEACLCTSDPDYSVSLFRALREEADSRYKFLKEEGFKNMYEFNKAMRKQGRSERCLKRTVVIADEFQVIFEKTDPKAQEELKAHITQIAKVARACGVHLLFCSQSMKGTISDDILSQFTLRFGLRCPMEVSLAVMGTKYSGDIREKNGYLYIASSDDKKKELQKRFRTPFIPDNVLRDRIALLAERAEAEGFTREEAITYDESTIHFVDEIDDLYNNELKDIDTKSLFILGERMVFSNKGRRSNIFLSRENNQHIFSVFTNPKDYIMFFKTIMRNIEHDNNVQCIFNSQVPDMSYLCEVDKYITDDNMFFYLEEQTPSTLIPVFQDILSQRETVEDLDTLKPLYIFLIGWDKALGFGIDSNYKLTEQYSVMMQICANYHIHFIMINTAQAEIPKAIITPAHHRIAGKCDEKSSTTLLDSNAAYKNYEQEDGYMFINTMGRLERLKIYRSKLTRKVKERELKI